MNRESASRPGGMRDWFQSERAVRYRWALEPFGAVVFAGLWTLAATLAGNPPEGGAVLLLAGAIAIARATPGWALVAGAIAVAAQTTVYSADLHSQVWAYPVAGALVFFASGAYGTTVVRWFGVASAILSAGVAALIIQIGVGFRFTGGDLDGFIEAGLQLASYAAVGQALAFSLVAAWYAGLSLNRRSRARSSRTQPATPRNAEEWLMDTALYQPGQGIGDLETLWRRMPPHQVVFDVGIAVFFLLSCSVWNATSGTAQLVVLLTFTIAVGLRRRAPALALVVAWLAAIIQMSTGQTVQPANIAVLAVLYTAAAYGRNSTRWAALASAGLGALVAATYVVLLGGGTTPLQEPLSPATDPFAAGGLGELAVRFTATLVASLGVLGLAWTVGLLVRTWRKARESRELEKLAIQEQRLAERTVVVEQERNRIARDMHDVVAHSLAVVIAQADGARYAKATDPDAVDTALSTISSTAREALGDVRILLAQLRQDETHGPQPVLADLDRLIEQMRGSGLGIAWTVTGTARPLGSGAQLAVYRVIQEALTNALRHGDRQQNVLVDLNWEQDAISARIDNAIRLSASATATDAGVGHGLPGMRERALLAGGVLTTDAAGGRFVVSLRIPAAGMPPGRATTSISSTSNSSTSVSNTAKESA